MGKHLPLYVTNPALIPGIPNVPQVPPGVIHKYSARNKPSVTRCDPKSKNSNINRKKISLHYVGYTFGSDSSPKNILEDKSIFYSFLLKSS